MQSEALSRHEWLNRLGPKQIADSVPNLALPDTAEPHLTRRGFIGASASILAMALIGSVIHPAEVEAAVLSTMAKIGQAQEQFGKYLIYPNPDYQKAGGGQSKLWLPARYSLKGQGYLQSIDQADLNQYGEQYAYLNLRGPEADFIQDLSDTQAVINHDPDKFWTGWCKAAAVASYHGPILTQGAIAFGVEASLADLMIMDTLVHAYCKVEDEWDNLTPEVYDQILARQSELQDQGEDTCLIGNTSFARGYPNQLWFGLVMGIDPNDGHARLVDFREWGDGNLFEPKIFNVPRGVRLPVQLVNPKKPDPVQEMMWRYGLFHREIPETFLGMRIAVPK